MVHSDNFDTIISKKAHKEGVRCQTLKVWDGYDEFRNPSYQKYTRPSGCYKVLIISQPYGLGSRNKALVLAPQEELFIPEGYVPPKMAPYLGFPAEPSAQEYLASPEMQAEALSRYSLA